MGNCDGIMRPGLVRAPVFEHPVVPGAGDGDGELGVFGDLVDALAGEAGQERREAQRRVDAVEIHVAQAVLDVPRAAAHVFEASRIEAVLVDRAAGDRVEPDVGHHLAVEEPRLDTVDVDDARRTIGELGRHATFERVRRLDDVVVARDHQIAPLGARRIGQQRHLALDVAGEVGVRGEFFE